MYGKQLRMTDFSIFGQIYQFQRLETIKNDHDTLNIRYFNTIQCFLKLYKILWKSPRSFPGLDFLKVIIFSQLSDFNEPKPIM